ncbi:hypothetical protein GCM10009779_57550 [Polymorphospora rubra]|uniref:Uncharacterized protein n=2 Tax=Polymorphospora rubra TaxID=338584 RepID=A0A810N635_9ACTN|nr:hypothetical protein Prubr_49950 [Polymorphospora rubra]
MRLFRTSLGRLTARSAAVLVLALGTMTLSAAPSYANTSVGVGQTLMTAGPADAREASQKLVSGLEDFNATFTEDSSAAGAAAVSQVRDEVAAGRLTVHLPAGATIAGADAKVWLSKTGERSIFLPYVGSLVKPSGLTVVFDAKGAVAGTLEAVYQEKSATSGTVAVWLNGELKANVLIDATGATTPAHSPAPSANNPITIQSWWDDFQYCLSNIMAVPGWAITGIGIACGIGCAISAGAGCLVCLTGAAGAYGFAVSYCIGWASS